MANQLSMAKIKSIETLHASGHSNRQIAKLLGVHRETVNGYVKRLKTENRPADDKAPIGENRPPQSKAPIDVASASKKSEGCSQTGVASQCEPHRQWIIDKLDQGLSATRIHQDLKRECSFTGSYYSVRRFVAKLQNKTPLPFRRMEVSPGEEAQIDFGTGAPVITPQGKKRRHGCCE